MKFVLSSLALLGLCACAGSYRDGKLETSDYFGQANSANIAAQAEAARHDEGTTDGDRMVGAVEKYKDGSPAPTNAPAASRVGTAN
jgi:hypothetical protein